MTKDEVALKVARKLRSSEGATASLDIVLDDVGAGWAHASLVLTGAMLKGHGTAHGGILFLLADSAFAYACNSANITTVAQAASIIFLSPARPGPANGFLPTPASPSSSVDPACTMCASMEKTTASLRFFREYRDRWADQ